MKSFFLGAVAILLILTQVTHSAAAPPSIDYSPQDQTVILYQTAGFGVIASGSGPLFYQWNKQGFLIPGATNDQLVLGTTGFADGGRYTVNVSNPSGSVTSEVAVLTINPPKTGDVDFSFSSGGLNNAVRSIVVRSDGKLLVAGDFTTVRGGQRGRVALLRSDGTTDFTFMNGLSGCDAYVNAAAIQSDGRIVVGGYFNTVNGTTRTRIARLHPDGSLDTSFSSTAFGGSKMEVLAIALQGDGKILVQTRDWQSSVVLQLLRLNPDGSLDGTFQPAVSGKTVNSVAVQSDGKIIVAGSAVSLVTNLACCDLFCTDFCGSTNSITRPFVARLHPATGGLDANFQNPFTNTTGFISAVAVQEDGMLIVGGDFPGAKNLTRLESNGTVDANFQNGLSGPNGLVSLITVQTNGAIIIVGQFSTVNGLSRTNIARLNFSGTVDESFVTSISHRGLPIFSVAVQDDARVLIGGVFSIATNITAPQLIARFNVDGSVDEGFEDGRSGANHAVYAAAAQTDGKVLIGGGFSSVDGVARDRIARLNPDGGLELEFLSGGLLTPSAPDRSVTAITVQSDGKILVGGGLPSGCFVTRLNSDGSPDNDFQTFFANGEVRVIVLQSDGKVLIGGSLGGFVMRLNSDGTRDSSFRPGLWSAAGGYGVFAMALQTDRKMIVGGNFTTLSGIAVNAARLNQDGSLDDTFPTKLSVGLYGVLSVAIQNDQKIILGGNFKAVNGMARTNLVRLNSDGTVDAGFVSGLLWSNIAVRAVAIQADGKVWVGADLSVVGGSTPHLLARLNSDGSVDQTLPAARPEFRDGGAINSIVLLRNGNVLIAGSLGVLNGMPARGSAQIWSQDFAPPIFSGIARGDGGDLILNWSAMANRAYRVQYTPVLSPPEWTDLSGDIVVTNSTGAKTDTTWSSATQRFYRVQMLP